MRRRDFAFDGADGQSWLFIRMSHRKSEVATNGILIRSPRRPERSGSRELSARPLWRRFCLEPTQTGLPELQGDQRGERPSKCDQHKSHLGGNFPANHRHKTSSSLPAPVNGFRKWPERVFARQALQSACESRRTENPTGSINPQGLSRL